MKLYFSYGKEVAPEGFEKRSFVIGMPETDIEEISALGVLEKHPDPVAFVTACYHALKPGGKVIFASVYYASIEAWMSPLTVRGVSECSLNWASKSWREQNKFTEIETGVDFDVLVGMGIEEMVKLKSDDLQVFWRTRYNNVSKAIYFTLTKR